MKIALKALLTACIALWVIVASAQSLEIIELRSRTVDEVLPTLLPLVESGGTLSGMNNQLFLRASPANRAEIKRALAAIDKPARRLIIRVRQSRNGEQASRGAEVSGQVVLGGTRRSSAEANVWDTRSQRHENAGQQVQTIEGGKAFIQVGQSLPIPMRQIIYSRGGAVVSESMVYRDIGSGFYAIPRVNGQRVTLDIQQQAERAPMMQGGAIDRQQISTTISGRLGEWMELGGSARESSREQGGFSVGTRDVRDQRSLWLMVEELASPE